MGIKIIDLGYSTTPSVEVFVKQEKLDGGIMISASHNGIEWNALKLFNSNGEFISKDDFHHINSILEKKSFNYDAINPVGKVATNSNSIEHLCSVFVKPLLINLGV